MSGSAVRAASCARAWRRVGDIAKKIWRGGLDARYFVPQSRHMKSSRSVLIVVFVGVLYAVVGIVTARMPAASHSTLVAWRLVAWVVSAIAYAAHIAYEHYRVQSSRRTTALRAATAAALGAFGLAVSARIHSYAAPSSHPFPMSALIVWPVMVLIPAFLVALAVAAVLPRRPPEIT